MNLSPKTQSVLLQSHVAYTTEETERPLPYRTRRRRAVVYRICIALAGLAAFALPLIGSY